MARLFDREVVLNVGGLRIASRSVTGVVKNNLTVQFKVTRSRIKDPNKATVSVFNLNRENRAALEGKNNPTVIEAGYVLNVSQIFAGVLQFGSSKQEGTDWITTFQSADGGTKWKTARINASFKGPVSAGDVLLEAGRAMGLNLGNLSQKAQEGSLRQELQEWVHGKVLSGRASRAFDRVIKSLGYGWSIQDGQIQILGPKEVIDQQAIVLRSADGQSTGLVGSPEPGEKGFVKARALLQPDLTPGRKVQIQSEQVEGFYRIERVTFTGDTSGGSWYSDIEAKPL